MTAPLGVRSLHGGQQLCKVQPLVVLAQNDYYPSRRQATSNFSVSPLRPWLCHVKPWSRTNAFSASSPRPQSSIEHTSCYFIFLANPYNPVTIDFWAALGVGALPQARAVTDVYSVGHKSKVIGTIFLEPLLMSSHHSSCRKHCDDLTALKTFLHCGKETYDKRMVSLLETSVHISPCSFCVKSQWWTYKGICCALISQTSRRHPNTKGLSQAECWSWLPSSSFMSSFPCS